MTGTTTVTTKGQVTIPQFIREQLQLQPGHRVTFTLDAIRQKIVAHVASRNTVKELYGSLKSSVPYSPRKRERIAAQAFVASRHIRK